MFCLFYYYLCFSGRIANPERTLRGSTEKINNALTIRPQDCEASMYLWERIRNELEMQSNTDFATKVISACFLRVEIKIALILSSKTWTIDGVTFGRIFEMRKQIAPSLCSSTLEELAVKVSRILINALR